MLIDPYEVADHLSTACQKAHWKEHKAFCRSVRDGTWTPYTFSDSITIGGQKLFTASLNFQSPLKSQTDKDKAAGGVPANAHEDKAFLVKLQRPLSEQREFRFPIMVYDRNRTFQGHIAPEDNASAWNTIVAQMPPSKLKIYRWAKRVGDWQLSLCLDREPSETPQW